MGKITTRRNLLFADLGLLFVLGITSYFMFFTKSTEARLNPQGLAYELNLDEAGKLWISDFKAKQVWSVDPISGSYKVYHVSGSPVDARQAGGWLWWADGLSNTVSQVSIDSGTYTEWKIPDAYGFLGTIVDDKGRLYATDSSNSYLYRLDPVQAELCTFTLPGYGLNNYIIRNGNYLWLVDWYDSSLLRLNISNNGLTAWSLPTDSSPFGMAVDEQGNLWYADRGAKMLVKLDPTTNQLTGYLLPAGNSPQMVASQSGMIWFTEEKLPSIGRLDPLTADHSIVSVTAKDQPLTPSCTNISPSSTGKIRITKGKMGLRDMAYPAIVNNDGWQIYQMPEGSDPWGIALADSGYVVDSGHQVLVRFALPKVFAPILSRTVTVTPSIETATITPTISFTQTQLQTPNVSSSEAPTDESFWVYSPMVLETSLWTISLSHKRRHQLRQRLSMKSMVMHCFPMILFVINEGNRRAR
jgi:streptogramin lyase